MQAYFEKPCTKFTFRGSSPRASHPENRRAGATRIVDENIRGRAGRQHELSTLFRRDVGSNRNNVDVCLRIRTADLPAHSDVQKRCCNDLCMCGL